MPSRQPQPVRASVRCLPDRPRAPFDRPARRATRPGSDRGCAHAGRRRCRAARGGRGGVLVVQGDPGVGKTALLEDTAKVAQQFRVLRTAGAEGEQEFPYAALHRFCAPALARIDQLPAPQRDALAVAFGLAAGPAPNQFVVALAVLGLLSSLATDQPVLVLVDDAHWLDRGSSLALAFVPRRLLPQPIRRVLSTPHPATPLPPLPD